MPARVQETHEAHRQREVIHGAMDRGHVAVHCRRAHSLAHPVTIHDNIEPSFRDTSSTLLHVGRLRRCSIIGGVELGSVYQPEAAQEVVDRRRMPGVGARGASKLALTSAKRMTGSTARR